MLSGWHRDFVNSNAHLIEILRYDSDLLRRLQTDKNIHKDSSRLGGNAHCFSDSGPDTRRILSLCCHLASGAGPTYQQALQCGHSEAAFKRLQPTMFSELVNIVTRAIIQSELEYL